LVSLLQVEIDEAAVRSAREPIRVVAQRRRRCFGQAHKLGDKDAHELWNSSQMECRPYKDPSYDLRRTELELGVQAVPVLCSVSVQVRGSSSSLGAWQLGLSMTSSV
jgi:dynein intermediate chain 3, axonemal